ncbi:MAG: thiamine-phosphate pyrophosphorylase [Gammaproteobacteria bacterium]|jgi:thiamine-phosphate pyrophosphorylase
MNMPNISGVYAITDCENITVDELLSKTESILSVGVALFQYRNKTEDQRKKRTLALELQSLCKKYKTPFIINDDLKLTKEIAADGLHLGQHDTDIETARGVLGDKIIGISCYNDFNRAVIAEQSGADYIAFGSFFPSATKPDAAKANIELIIKSKEIFNIPVVAIGGITPENGKQLINAKVDFLAVINGVYSTDDAASSTLAYNNLFIT